MNNYQAKYEKWFVDNLQRYASLKTKIRKCVELVLYNPYLRTELLKDLTGKLNLKGCRSIRVDRNFRIIFVICEECRHLPKCEYCFCENLPDNTIIF
jgi:mRNA-degrading endonuclease YafQ of YafQ-DinJ toxin-antitoxin module